MNSQLPRHQESIHIRKCEARDTELITNLAVQTFKESHGHSAPKEDIENYLSKAFTQSSISQELSDAKNVFHLLYLGDIPIGYSKLKLDTAIVKEGHTALGKLERIYVLSEFHGLGFGKKLMDHAINLAKEKDQKGMWLYTWTENQQAIDFYLRYGFEIIGKYDFRISATHVNPNHQMLLIWGS